MKYVKSGSVISIPLPDGGSCNAVVLFVSRYFRNVMLIGLFADGYRDSSGYTTGDLCDSIKVLVYTSQVMVKKGKWPIVGEIALPSIASFTERIDGQSVWVEDQRVRTATREDKATIPIMGVDGQGAVELLAEEIASRCDYSQSTQIDIKRTCLLIDKIRASNF